MINYEEARRLVLQYLAGIDGKERKTAEMRKDLTARERELLGLGREDAAPGTALVENATIEGEFGWVFFYQSKKLVKYTASGRLMSQTSTLTASVAARHGMSVAYNQGGADGTYSLF